MGDTALLGEKCWVEIRLFGWFDMLGCFYLRVSTALPAAAPRSVSSPLDNPDCPYNMLFLLIVHVFLVLPAAAPRS